MLARIEENKYKHLSSYYQIIGYVAALCLSELRGLAAVPGGCKRSAGVPLRAESGVSQYPDSNHGVISGTVKSTNALQL